MPLNIKKFVSDFAGMRIMILINIFSGYNQLTLDLRNRDFIGFLSSLDLLRSTSISQRIINGVAQFSRYINIILGPLAFQVANNFFNNIGVKAPKTTYNNEESLPRIRRFVIKYL